MHILQLDKLAIQGQAEQSEAMADIHENHVIRLGSAMNTGQMEATMPVTGQNETIAKVIEEHERRATLLRENAQRLYDLVNKL